MSKIGRPVREIPKSNAFGAIILSIVRGNTATMKIAQDLNKHHATIIEQLGDLQKEGWLKRNKNKEYSVNFEKLADYYAKQFNLSKKILKNNLPLWLGQFSATPYNVSIEAIGVYVQSNTLGFSMAKKMMAEAGELDTDKLVKEMTDAMLKNSDILKKAKK